MKWISNKDTHSAIQLLPVHLVGRLTVRLVHGPCDRIQALALGIRRNLMMYCSLPAIASRSRCLEATMSLAGLGLFALLTSRSGVLETTTQLLCTSNLPMSHVP